MPPQRARVLTVAWVVAVAILGLLAWRLGGVHGPGGLDAAIDARLRSRVQEDDWVLHVIVIAGGPIVTVVGSALLAAICAAMRWWRGVLLALLAPAAASVATETVLKPLVHRTMRDALSFPSGTTTRACALAAVAGVLLLPRSRSVPEIVVRVVMGAAALAVGAAVAVSVVVLNWHYPTDALGGMLTAVVIVVGLALTIDAVARLLGPAMSDRRQTRREPPACGTRGVTTTGRPR